LEIHLNSLLLKIEFISLFQASAETTTSSPSNATQTREEITSLHHLLHAYKSILYRYNEESISGRGLDNFQSTQGRPDRPRSKFTTDQAIQKLHQVDEIFPWYAKYFNETKDDTSFLSVMDVLDKRVENIQEKLESIENGGSQKHGINVCLGIFGIVNTLMVL
jgi:hypothetical protein